MAVSDKRPAEPPIGWTSVVSRQGFHAPPAAAVPSGPSTAPARAARSAGKQAVRSPVPSPFRMEAARQWPTARLAHADQLRPADMVRVRHVAGATEAMALARLEQRARALGRGAGTEALLRAGLRLLAGLDDAAFLAALHRGSRP